MKKQYFLLVTLFYAIVIFYLAATTPISPHEAKILYASHNHDIVAILMKFGESFISGVLGLRIFSIFFGFMSILFLYEFSRRYFSKREDAYLSTFIFMLLPGIVTGSTLVNVAILVLPLVLLFVLLYEKNHFVLLPFIMLALFFIHEASIIFFIAVLMYAVIHKDKKLSIFSGAFLLAFIYLAKGIEIGGRPSGHFAEVFGLYAAIFSPLVFLYFFYTMYRILLIEKKTLVWYISFTALAFSLILSIRQRISLTDFAPYVLIAIPLMLDLFHHSLRVRLPEFQKRYKLGFKVLTISLFLSVFIIFAYQVMFFVVKDHKKYFSNNVYEPYFLAKELKSKGIHCKDTSNVRERYQLQYYNILPCTK
jgi:hypothetical protein